MTFTNEEIQAMNRANGKTKPQGFTPKTKGDRQPTQPTTEPTAPTLSKHQANVDKASQLATQSTESVKGSVGGEIQAIAKELQAAAAKDSQLVEQASDFLATLHTSRRARILEATQRKIQSASVVEPEADVIEPQGFTSLFDDDLVIDVDWENLVFTSQPQLTAGA